MSGQFGFGAAGTSPPPEFRERPFLPNVSLGVDFRAVTAFVLSALVLAGCARPTAASWQGADLARVERDHAECRAQSLLIQPTTGGLGGLAGASMILSGLAAQREYYDNCMTARGYTKKEGAR